MPCQSGELIRIRSVWCTVNGATDGDTLTLLYQRDANTVLLGVTSCPVSAAVSDIFGSIGGNPTPLSQTNVDPVTGDVTYAVADRSSLGLPDLEFNTPLIVSPDPVGMNVTGTLLTYEVEKLR